MQIQTVVKTDGTNYLNKQIIHFILCCSVITYAIGTPCNVTDGSAFNLIACEDVVDWKADSNPAWTCSWYQTKGYCANGEVTKLGSQLYEWAVGTNGMTADTACCECGGAGGTDACTCGNVECTVDTGLICYSTTGGGSCRKKDFGPYGYMNCFNNDGNDNIVRVDGRYQIDDVVSCNAAADSMSLGHMILPSTLQSAPYGCSKNWNGAFLQFYSDSSSTISCEHDSLYEPCICISALTCEVTDGTISNVAPCICGKSACSFGSGLYCDLSIDRSTINTCSHGDACTIIDGSAENSVDCACGTAACNDYNGKFCYAEGNLCANSAFSNRICSIRDGSASSRSSSDSECICGNTVCTEFSGLICDTTLTTHTCSMDDCHLGDRGGGPTVENAAPCRCIEENQQAEGTTEGACSFSSGLYCDLIWMDENNNRVDPTCSPGDACLNTDGSAENAVDCACGSRETACNNFNGNFCDATSAKCSGGDACSNTDGSLANVACTCGAKACNGGNGFYCKLEEPFVFSDGSSTSSGARSGRCSLLPSTTCTFTNGEAAHNTTANVDCTCGTTACTLSTGFYCYKDLNTCGHGPLCNYTKGYILNADTCQCGLSECDISTGFYCDTSFSACSKLSRCPIDDGSLPNNVSCSCGVTECPTDHFCSALSSSTGRETCTPIDCSVTVDEMLKRMPNCGRFNNRCQCIQCKRGFYSADCNDICPAPEVAIRNDIILCTMAMWCTLAYIVSEFCCCLTYYNFTYV